MTRLFLIALSALVTAPGIAHAKPKSARAMRLCQTEDGRILVRNKCKSKETTLDVAKLTEVAGAGAEPGPQGEQGPQGETGPQGPPGPAGGLDTASCRLVEGRAASTMVPGTSIQAAVVQVNCEPTVELLVTWGYHFDEAATIAGLRSARLQSTDHMVADGLIVTTAGNNSAHTLNVRVVCCPRS